MLNDIQNPTVYNAAKTLWDYHKLNHKISLSDCIIIMGSQDIRVAKRGAQLFLAGFAPFIIITGGYGRFTKSKWHEPEAIVFRRILLDCGVNQKSIFTEQNASNTGENVLFSIQLARQIGLPLQKIIAVQKPYLERRAYAVFKRHYPNLNITLTSPQISFEKYIAEGLSPKLVVSLMVGDLQRIMVYPKLGYQTTQFIPQKVLNAYKLLVNKGYTSELIREKQHG
jgi:uncharacterized SAM-binding protein YcdF (DUF218 family)